MKILMIGDTHGVASSIAAVLPRAQTLGITKAFIVGDFGLFTHEREGIQFLDEVNAAAMRHGVTVYALPGNHENHDHWQWYNENLPQDQDKFTILRSHIRLSKRIQHWSWNGRVFFVAGGAASIDKAVRLRSEARKGRSRTLWWPEEQLSDGEVASVLKVNTDRVKVAYLLTHDCSNSTPFGMHLVPNFDSQLHRHKIDKILQHLKPEMHFHGHMHNRYEWNNIVGYDADGEVEWVSTFGLDCNNSHYANGVLDTERSRDTAFTWLNS